MFDPRECDAAQICLEAGNPQAAAKLLLESPHGEHREVRRLLLECGAALAAQARKAFQQGELTACEEILALSRRCAELPFDAVVLQQQLARARKVTIVAPPPPLKLNDRNVAFALRGRALVLPMARVVLGSVRNQAAQAPLLGRLHREHASITRHEQTYWLARAPHHDDLVAVNGAAINVPRALEHGDRITLGPRRGRGACELTFVYRSPASMTAVLVQEQRAVMTPSGDAFDRIVLLGDCLTIGRAANTHLPSPNLACREVRLAWTDAGLTMQVLDGRAYEETADGDWRDPPVPLTAPCRLVVAGDESLAEQIVQDFRHGADLDERLEVFDPQRAR